MTAALALGIHLDNKQKRKAAAIDVFLNVASQRKFLKMASIEEGRQEIKKLTEQKDNYKWMYRYMKRQYELWSRAGIDNMNENAEQFQEVEKLREENEKLHQEDEKLRSDSS